MYYFTKEYKGHGETLETATDKQTAEIRTYELKKMGFKVSIVYQSDSHEYCNNDCINCSIGRDDKQFCPVSVKHG